MIDYGNLSRRPDAQKFRALAANGTLHPRALGFSNR